MSIEHSKIEIQFNDSAPTDLLRLELHFDPILKALISQMAEDFAKKCKCDHCKKGLWDHFWATVICEAVELNVQAYTKYALKTKFKGNTREVSKAMN